MKIVGKNKMKKVNKVLYCLIAIVVLSFATLYALNKNGIEVGVLKASKGVTSKRVILFTMPPQVSGNTVTAEAINTRLGDVNADGILSGSDYESLSTYIKYVNDEISDAPVYTSVQRRTGDIDRDLYLTNKDYDKLQEIINSENEENKMYCIFNSESDYQSFNDKLQKTKTTDEMFSLTKTNCNTSGIFPDDNILIAKTIKPNTKYVIATFNTFEKANINYKVITTSVSSTKVDAKTPQVAITTTKTHDSVSISSKVINPSGNGVVKYCYEKASTSSILLGDVDKDGKITTTDSRMILRYVQELEVFSDEQIKLSDLNRDGKVNEDDSTLALRTATQLEPLKVAATDCNGTYRIYSNNQITGLTAKTAYIVFAKYYDENGAALSKAVNEYFITNEAPVISKISLNKVTPTYDSVTIDASIDNKVTGATIKYCVVEGEKTSCSKYVDNSTITGLKENTTYTAFAKYVLSTGKDQTAAVNKLFKTSTKPKAVTPTPTPTPTPTVAPATSCGEKNMTNGSTGDCVRQLQQLLKDKGCYTGSVDGEAGNMTYNAIKAYQSKNGLSSDGICGPLTWSSINSSNAKNCSSSGNSSSGTTVNNKCYCNSSIKKCYWQDKTPSGPYLYTADTTIKNSSDCSAKELTYGNSTPNDIIGNNEKKLCYCNSNNCIWMSYAESIKNIGYVLNSGFSTKASCESYKPNSGLKCGRIMGEKLTNTWSKGNWRIGVVCIDDKIGCKQEVFYYEIGEGQSYAMGSFNIEIENKAGSKKVCKIIGASIYVDNKAPIIKSVSGLSSASSTKTTLGVLVNEKDNPSYTYCVQHQPNQLSSCKWFPVTGLNGRGDDNWYFNVNKDAQGEKFFYNKTYYLYIKDGIGNVSLQKEFKA